MYQVLDIMSEYFDEKPKSSQRILREEKLPVKTQRNHWSYQKDPDRLVAEFKFNTADSYSFFISEVAAMEKKISHHGNITCIYPSVRIEVRTHDLDMVTKSDIKYTKKVLEIYRDASVLEREL